MNVKLLWLTLYESLLTATMTSTEFCTRDLALSRYMRLNMISCIHISRTLTLPLRLQEWWSKLAETPLLLLSNYLDMDQGLVMYNHGLTTICLPDTLLLNNAGSVHHEWVVYVSRFEFCRTVFFMTLTLIS